MMTINPEQQQRMLVNGVVLFGCSVIWLFGCLVVWLFDCLVVWLFDCLVVWWFGCLVDALSFNTLIPHQLTSFIPGPLLSSNTNPPPLSPQQLNEL
jgi:hypothetical protein